jgi:hypothetical protein
VGWEAGMLANIEAWRPRSWEAVSWVHASGNCSHVLDRHGAHADMKHGVLAICK